MTSHVRASDGGRFRPRPARPGAVAESAPGEPLGRLHGWLMRHAVGLAEPLALDGFRLFLHPVPHPFYRNTAVPVSDAVDWPAALRRLDRLAAERGFRPRIECIAELFPRLARALEAAGFRLERAPAMLAEVRPGVPPAGVELPAALEPSQVQGFLAAMLAAFGGPPPRRAEIQQLLACHRAGRLRLAWRRAGGRILAGAALGICDDTAELMGVFTAADCRGQGHAGAVCAALADRFARGGGRFLWLAAEKPASGLYDRLGFRPVGTRLEAFAPRLAGA